jgi:hypothetical protein
MKPLYLLFSHVIAGAICPSNKFFGRQEPEAMGYSAMADCFVAMLLAMTTN